MAYSDDFNLKYEHPQVNNTIVGFSGIDPQRKSSEGSDCLCDSSTLSDAQKEIVRQIIRDVLSVIDLSDCSCDLSILSDEQKEIIRKIIDQRLQDFTISYDGGRIDDEDEPNPEPVTSIDEYDLDHEKLSGLLGGDNNGHYHLTKDELLKIAAYPAFSNIKHESLPDLLGGDANGHLHLTAFELKKLQIMIDTFFPDGSDSIIIKPVAPDTDDNPIDDDPFGGLPSGTPPDWELKMLPSGCEATEYAYKMYYGLIPSEENKAIIVALVNSKDGKIVRKETNLGYWENGLAFSYATKIYSYYYSPVRKAIYYAGEPATSSSSGLGYKTKSGGGSVISATKVNGYFNSLCYFDTLGVLLAATDAGEARKITINSSSNKVSDAFSTYLSVNPGCAAWHPVTAVFCLTGREGTSTSYNGETWTLNPNAPHDLRELSYREDLGQFVAWSGEDKTFYASPDGIIWTQLSDTPIPLDNISSVHYEPTKGWYCAVGIGDPYAYFSKDLKHWVPTRLRNNSPVDVADVISYPNTGNFVAIPTSGSYYYEFFSWMWTD